MLLAVHISDGVLLDPWTVGGWAAAAALLAVSARRMREEELPKVGVLTAALFVASSAHLPLGPSSAHLLLNGLAGVILGRRVVLAVAVGLFLQVLLLGHGGTYTLGVNITVYSLPALAAGLAFPLLRRSRLLHRNGPRFVAVWAAAAVWEVTAVAAVQWGWGKAVTPAALPSSWDGWWVFEPVVGAVLALVAAVVAWAEQRVERDPDFPLGLLLGAATGYATVALNCFVLVEGGKDGVPVVAGLILLAHLPIIAAEAVGVGFVVAFLAKAKPEWLERQPAGSGNTSSNGTSH